MTTATTTMRVWAADYGAETFAPNAFAGQIGTTIPVVDAASGNHTHGILRHAEITEDGTEATLTFEIAHIGESMLGRRPFQISRGFNLPAEDRPWPFGPAPEKITVTYTAPARATLGELGWPAVDPATTEQLIEAAARALDNLHMNTYFDPQTLGPQGMLLVTTKCECSHSITNHLTGHCDVCPCQRSAATMAIKLNIEE